jgi:poly(3-hydroxybutyrate) depolymerase
MKGSSTKFSRLRWLQLGVGHYGVFNGSRFRAEIVPRVAEFIRMTNANGTRGPSATNAPART